MSALDEIVEEARRQALSRDHVVVTAAHAVLALRRRAPHVLRRYFTLAEVSDVESMIAGAPVGATLPTVDVTVSDLVRSSRSADDPVDALASSLRDLFPSSDAFAGVSVEPITDFDAGAAQVAVAMGSGAPPLRSIDLTEIRQVARMAPNATPMSPRLDEATTVIAITATRDPQAALVVAPDGSGRSTFAQCIAARMLDGSNGGALFGWPVVMTNTEGLLNFGVATPLGKILDACSGKAVVFIDDVDVLAALGTTAPDMAVLTTLRGALHDPSLRIVLSMNEAYLERLQTANREFYEELVKVRLTPLAPAEIERILRASAGELAAHHAVSIPDNVVTSALEPPGEADVLAHPGLAIERLDRAATDASLRDDRIAKPSWQMAGARRSTSRANLAEAAGRLKSAVLGQEHAIDAVLQRLRVTLAGLDERPERPNGVFLFAGPTGTGKTELATRLAAEAYGSADHLIRLDMSEYSDRWSTSKLIGPGPGFLGSQEPEGWLTTRVRRNPHAVLLLDEIEKADPVVWSTFLQVFDAGRLTDGAGRTADFRDIIVVMTSNIGAHHFAERNPTGFASEGTDVAAQVEDVLGELKRTMPPELLNRIDEIVVFRPLSSAVVREIARAWLDRVVTRLATGGWAVTVGRGVVDVLAVRGYDPAYGARPLQRLIEREVVAPIAALPVGPVHLNVEGDRIVARS